jgi:hypothetical protein
LLSYGKVNKYYHFSIYPERRILYRKKFKNLTESDLFEFGLKFSERMKFVFIENFDNKQIKTILNLTPNIEKIVCNDFHYYFGPNEIYFSKLREIKFTKIENLINFKPFADKY